MDYVPVQLLIAYALGAEAEGRDITPLELQLFVSVHSVSADDASFARWVELQANASPPKEILQ